MEGVQEPVFHMCDAIDFNAKTANDGIYYSPTFDSEKFIHATADPALLLSAGNYFYKAVVGNWICIKLEPTLLGGPVVYESAAPVGSTEVEANSAPKYPHIYGGIPGKAVISTYAIQRGEDGTFLSIPGLC
mmetsp:Transcript_35921/g.34004  ORF Transcript_35921/g.34004 Transcript_35921/m.34004 type:complete len:131 (+) Transcript_35921:65-457(+)